MANRMQRRTVYAATLVALLALAGGWAFAAGTIHSGGPAQNSKITVTAPNGFTAAYVQSTQLIQVSSALLNSTAPAGTQPVGSNGLNSSSQTNALLPSCAGTSCLENYSAVDSTHAMIAGDTALQLALRVNQSVTASGFDIQVEILMGSGFYNFGSGYFNSNTGTTFVWVFLYVDLGVNPITTPLTGDIVSDIVVTFNSCSSATTCP
jgi:hypothetical protein